MALVSSSPKIFENKKNWVKKNERVLAPRNSYKKNKSKANRVKLKKKWRRRRQESFKMSFNGAYIVGLRKEWGVWKDFGVAERDNTTDDQPSELVSMLISHISSHKSELRRAKKEGEKRNSELLYGSTVHNTFKNPETKTTKEHFQKVKLFFFVWSHGSQSRFALFSAEIPRPRTNPMPRRVPIYSQMPV